jgi:hypothetical protein
VPWIHTRDNRDCNFVAACGFCNAWKSGEVYDDIETIRELVARKWLQSQAESDVPAVPE